MPPGDVAPVLMGIVFMVSAAAVFILRGPVGRALARRIEGGKSPDDVQALTAVDEMQVRVAQLEQQVDRMHELEERLDFTERLLAQQREQPRIGS